MLCWDIIDWYDASDMHGVAVSIAFLVDDTNLHSNYIGD